MSVMQILHIIACIIYIELVVFVLWGKRRKDLLNRSLALFLGCLIIWALGLSFIESPYTSKAAAMMWLNGYSISWIGFCSAFLYFSLVFTQSDIVKKKWLYLPLVGLPLLFLYAQYTSGIAFIHTVKQPYGWTYEWVNSGWRYMYWLYFLSFFLAALTLLLKFKKQTQNHLKTKQADIIIKVTILSLSIGTITDVIFPAMRLFAIPPVAPITTLLWSCGLVYAIVKYKFLEVSTAIAAEQIIETINECFVLTDNRGIIVKTNSAAEHLLGWGKDELLAKHIKNIFPEDYYNIIIAQRIKDVQELRNQDALLINKTRKLIDVILSFSFLKDDKGQTIGVVYIARDIQERKKIEQELKRLAAVVRYSMELVGLATVDGNMIFLNEAGCKMLGIAPEAVGKHHLMEVIAEPYKELMYKEVLPALLRGKTWEGNLQYRNLKTGEFIDVRTMAFGIKDSASPVTSFLAVISIDITESKRMQDNLKEESGFSEAVINSLPGVFYLLDQEGNFLRWNKNFESVTGYSSEEMSKSNALDFFKGNDKQKVTEAIKTVFEYGQYFVEARFVTKEGKEIPYLFNGYRITLQGSILLVGIGLDITAQKIIERDLYEKQLKLNSILKASPTGIGVVVNRVLIQVNKSFCEMVGYAAEELLGQSARMLYLSDEDFELVGQEKYRQIQEKGVGSIETAFRKKDGSVINVFLSSVALDVNNLAAGVVFTAQDITDSKRKTKLLMDAANAWLETFDAMVDGVSIHNANFEIINVNKSLCSMVNKTKDELIGKHCYEIFHGTDQPVTGCPLEACKLTGHQEHEEFFESFLQKWLAVSTSPLYDAQHNITRIVHVVRDITERKQKEA